MFDKDFFKIRPSQVTRTFGPGSIYDNQRDSVIILGMDFWNPQKFENISDRLLIREIRKEQDYFKNVSSLVSVSSHVDDEDPGVIPVRSFPNWGVCPTCHKLQYGRNNKTGNAMECDSKKCKSEKTNNDIDLPKTNPVRYVTACTNGHLDEFPWYEWVHRSQNERDKCGRNDAEMYLLEDTSKISMESTFVECKNPKCIAVKQNMGFALSPEGLLPVRRGCTKRRPWLKNPATRCDGRDGNIVNMRGMFKGSSSMYFPLTRSILTIPPFSDRLAIKIDNLKNEIIKHIDKAYFDSWLETEFEVKTEKNPDGQWTLQQVKDKIRILDRFDADSSDFEIKDLEFQALTSVTDIDDEEFVTESLQSVEPEFDKFVERVVMVKKIRVVSAITGFTRIDALDGSNTVSIAEISSEMPQWLPAMENRGEAVFVSFNDDALQKWEEREDVQERISRILAIQNTTIADATQTMHSPRYMLLHSIAHSMIKSLSEVVGYNSASMAERIYAGPKMAGILIYTASPSSDGSLGGLVEIGRDNGKRFWNIFQRAIERCSHCSYDPLCSSQEPEKILHPVGSACQGCLMLPETSCESMNRFLDRSFVSETLANDLGFFRNV
jgi:hypothetical protein